MAIHFESIIVVLWYHSLKNLEKWAKTFSHKDCSANYDGKKLETPECPKMRILIIKDTHDIINFIGI